MQEVEVDNVLIRFPTWTRDVAEAVRFLLERKEQGVFHVSSPTGATRYELTLKLAEIMQKPSSHIKPSEKVIPRRAQRPEDAHLDTAKIQALGFSQLTPYDEICRELLRSVNWHL